ncbi:MAG: CARDB domain-containing protein [Candidatus Eisenbacteria bacterium]
MSHRAPLTLATAFAAACAAMLVLSATAHASEGPSIGATLVSLDAPVVAGTPVTFDVQLNSLASVTLRDFRVVGGSGAGGPAIVTGLPADSLVIPIGQPAVLHLTTLPTSSDGLFALSFQLGGSGARFTKYLDLSRRHFDRMRRPQLANDAYDAFVVEPTDTSGLGVGPGPAPPPVRPATLKPVRDVRATNAALPAAALHVVRVHGRVTYMRPDSSGYGVHTLPADHITVRIYDEDWDSDDLLWAGTTDALGYFDVNVSSSESAPDLYVEFETANGAVEVEDGTWQSNYTFRTGVKEDFTGAEWDVGSRTSTDTYIRPAIHMLTTITRAWRWWHINEGEYLPAQDFQWPDGDWPHYSHESGDLHIPQFVGGVDNGGPRWSEKTLVHEWGHAIMNEWFDNNPSNTYDNDICDNANGDPGHCAFCQEDGGTALKEGWSNFLQDAVLATWNAKYGLGPYSRADYESQGACMDNGNPSYPCACSPYSTEGIFTALLRDLQDHTPGEHDDAQLTDPSETDEFDASIADVNRPFRMHSIASPAQYLTWFQVANPSMDKAKFWLAAKMNGYDIPEETVPPPAPANFTSTDHAIGVESPDHTVTLTWTQAPDDFSGVRSWWLFRATSSNGPWESISAAPVRWTPTCADTVPVGSYWYAIEAWDLAGNHSARATLGPIMVRAPFPADYTGWTQSGWTANVVARDSAGATASYCPVTPTLEGGAATTRFNVAGRNIGEQAGTALQQVRLFLDGVQVDAMAFAGSSPNVSFLGTNRGPFTVRGGRHTLEAFYDASEATSENSETNNNMGRQFTWIGEKLSSGVRVRRAAPPDPTGGHGSFSVAPPNVKFKNVDGLYYSHTTPFPLINTYWWSAVWVASTGDTGNVDCYLQNHSTGTADGGYTTGIATSARTKGQLDAVFTNHRVLSTTTWDVGVINANNGPDAYFAQQLLSPLTALVTGDSVTVTLADSMMMMIRELDLTAADIGKTLVEVRRTSGTSPLYSLWLANDYTYGTISTYDGKVQTDARTGVSQLTITTTAAGKHALVVYRNPADGWGAVTFTVKLAHKPGDPEPVQPAGWAGPLVPRPVADATSTNVPLPTTLAGDTAPTYVNVAVLNNSDAAATNLRTDVYLDRTFSATLNTTSIAANAQLKLPNTRSFLVPAGRHVLEMRLDPLGSMNELDETNNRYARQWVWLPATATLEQPVWRRGTNGGPTEGMDRTDTLETFALNRDGLRSPVFAAGGPHFAAFAVMPRTGSDVDLTLHERATSPTNGFEDDLAYSGWEGDGLDYLLVDFDATSYRGFDAGVIRASDDTASYVAQVVAGQPHPGTPGVVGAWTMAADDVLDLHEFDLPAGHYDVDLVNQSGSVDWGLAVHGMPRPYQSRLDGPDVAASWLAPAGSGEHVTFNVPIAGRYALAVYKTGAAERAKSGQYALTLNVNVTGVDGPAPRATRLAGARPNPTAGPVTLAFELARAGRVELDVYDVRGAHVRMLVQGALAPGAHSAVWDGRTDDGRHVGAGLYFARFRASGVEQATRLVRVE